MLKTTPLSERFILKEVDNGVGSNNINGGDVEIAKKFGKSKGQKTSKS